MLIHANVQRIRHELEESLPHVTGLWFPKQSDIDRWNQSNSQLYVRWLPGDHFEIGPRLASLNAARLCPVFRGYLTENGTGKTRLSGRLRFPRETEILMGFWGLFISLWGVALWLQVGRGDLPWGWWVWWGILTFFCVIAVVLGRIMGGHHLQQGLLELKKTIEQGRSDS